MGEGHDCRWGRRVATRRGPDRAVERDHGHRTRRDSATFAPPGENQAGSPFPRARAALRPDWSPETGEPSHRRRRPMSEPPQPYTPYAASGPKPRPAGPVVRARRGDDAARHRGRDGGDQHGGRRRHRRGRRDHGQRPGGRHRLAREQVADALRAVGAHAAATATSSTAPDRRCSSARSWRPSPSPRAARSGGRSPRSTAPATARSRSPAGRSPTTSRRSGSVSRSTRPSLGGAVLAGDRGDPGARRRRVRGPAGDHDPVVHPQAADAAPDAAPELAPTRLRPRPRRAAPPGWARAAR